MTASRADARNMRAAVEDGHAAKIRLAAGIVATAFLGAIGAGVTPKDIAAALDREAGSNDAARVAMGRLREVAGELAALIGRDPLAGRDARCRGIAHAYQCSCSESVLAENEP